MDAVADVQSYLAQQGLVDGSSGWTSYRSVLRDRPDKVVIITEDGGLSPEIPASSGIGDDASQFEGIQIRVRGEPGERDAAKTKVLAVRDALHGLNGGTLGSTVYEGISAVTSSPVYIGPDDNDRPEFTQSFRLMSPVPV